MPSSPTLSHHHHHPKGLSYYLCPRVLSPRPKEAGRWLILHSWEANNSISGEAAVGGACSAHSAQSLCFMASRPVYFHSPFYCFLLVPAFLCLRDNAACVPAEMICRCLVQVALPFFFFFFFFWSACPTRIWNGCIFTCSGSGAELMSLYSGQCACSPNGPVPGSVQSIARNIMYAYCKCVKVWFPSTVHFIPRRHIDSLRYFLSHYIDHRVMKSFHACSL